MKLKYVSEEEKKLRDRYESIDREILAKTAQERAIQLYSMDASNMGSQHYTIWRSFEKDGKPYWDSPETISKMSDKVVMTLYSRYMEVDSQDPWELTKSVSKRGTKGMGKNGKRRSKRKPASA